MDMDKRIIVTLCVSVLCFGSATPSRGESPSRKAAAVAPAASVVATIGSRSITIDDVQTLLEKRSGRPATAAEKRQLLEEMVHFELLYSAARKAGYDRDPELLAAFERMVAGQYREKYLRPKLQALTVSDAEIDAYYQKNQQRFTLPRSIRAAVIKIAIPAMASDETRAALWQRAEAARNAALALDPAATPSFGSVAVEFSSDQVSRYRGGDTGWMRAGLSDGVWPQALLDALQSLTKSGEIAPLLTLDDGYYLYKLIGAKEAAVRPLAEVRGEVYQRVMNDKRAEVEQAFFVALQKSIPVTTNEKLLETIKSPHDGAAQRPPALPR